MKSIDRCLAVQERALKRIPGMTQLLSKRPDRFSMGVWPSYYDRAEGARVWDLDGNEYMDMSIGGIGANVLGYADPDVNAAVLEAVRKGVSSSLNCAEEVELADLLCELHPWAEQVRFARTGGEAMSMAVRIARAATRRDVVAFCGYHGWHDWYLSANIGTDEETQDALKGHLQSGLNPTGVPRGLKGTALPFHYNDLAALEAIAAEHKLAAIVMEPIRNFAPAPGFLEGVRAIADREGAALVVDEISAGFRINVGGAHLTLGLTPDVAVFSKALGNGHPIAAVIGKQAVMEAAQRTFISSTNWTERIGPVAALATIRKFAAVKAHERLVALGAAVQQGWGKIAARHGVAIEVSGIPPLSHFHFEHPEDLGLRALFVQEMLDRGYLASNAFYPMYAHSDADVDGYLKAADEAFGTLAGALAGTGLAALLRGKPAVAGFKRLT